MGKAKLSVHVRREENVGEAEEQGGVRGDDLKREQKGFENS
jgi:hypothetical protein